MPEKKSGMTDFWKGMFKIKKPYYDDIVYQAERIISDYVDKRNTEMMNGYSKKKHHILNFSIFGVSCMIVYLLYRLAV